MTSLSIDSGSTYDLAGYDFTLTSSGAVANSGIFRLKGKENLNSVTDLGTAAGTVVYYGYNVVENIPLKDFGSTDYYNLTINDTNTNKATFQTANGNDLTIAGDLHVSLGTLDISTNANTLTFSGSNKTLYVDGGTLTATNGNISAVNVTISLGTLNAPGSGKSFAVSNNWDSSTGGTFNAGTGTVEFSGGTLPSLPAQASSIMLTLAQLGAIPHHLRYLIRSW